MAAFVLLLLLMAGGAATVHATSVRPLTLSEMVQRSARIVHGSVVATESRWEEGGGRIYTYVTLSPRETLKGQHSGGGPVIFRQIGGQIGDQAVYVPGTPTFRPKQEVLVFLTGEDGGGYPQIMGIYQGAFRPGAGGRRSVEGLSPEAVGSLLPEKGSAAPGAAAAPEGGSFEQFMQRIRDLVSAQAGGPAR